MRKFAVFAACAAGSLVLAQNASGPLGGFTKALTDAQALSATFTYQRIGGVAQNFKIDVAKPNKLRLDKPNELIVADGTTIVTFDKKANTYSKAAQTPAAIKAIVAEDEFSLFAPFFNADAYDSLSKVTAAGTKNRKGTALNVVEAQVDKNGLKTATFYIDPASNLARQLEYGFTDNGQVTRTLIDTKEIKVSASADSSLFAFKAPDGARELSADELNSDKWYHDLEEAKKIASATHRKIFVDFMATWCGPCKMLAADVFGTPEFKKLSKYFVFLQIDVDAQKDVAKQYGITAMPTQMVLDANGDVVGKTVGYGGAAAFFDFINQYAN